MKSINLTFAAIITIVSFNLKAQNFDWDLLKTAPNSVSLKSNVTDNANNTYVVGAFYSSITVVGTTTYNAFSTDGIIIKYDANYNVLWSASIGGSGAEDCTGISTDSNGNIFVVGWTTSSVVSVGSATFSNLGGTTNPDFAIFICKFNSNGNLNFFKTVSHGDGINSLGLKLSMGLNSMLINNVIFNNNTIAFGNNSLTVTGQNVDTYIASFDLNANLNWVKFYSSPGYKGITDIVIQKNDDIYFTGSTTSQSLVIGSYTLSCPSNSVYLGFLARMDPAGNIKWLNSLVNANVTSPRITASNTNTIYIAFPFTSNSLSLGSNTYTSQNFDCVLAQLDSLGNYKWSKIISGNNGADVRSIVVNQNKYIYVTGRSNSNFLSTQNYSISNSNTVANMYFAAFDSQGKDWGFLISSRPNPNGNTGPVPYSISMDLNNNGYIVGSSNLDLVCGTQTISNNTQAPSFMAKIKLLNGVGIKESSAINNDVIIFPNPTSSVLNFNSQYIKTANIEITNALGQNIYQKQDVDLNQSLDISFLNAGVYFVKIQNQLSQKTLKVIKE